MTLGKLFNTSTQFLYLKEKGVELTTDFYAFVQVNHRMFIKSFTNLTYIYCLLFIPDFTLTPKDIMIDKMQCPSIEHYSLLGVDPI